MHIIAQNERETPNRIVKLFVDQLDYRYLGNWEDRNNNSNIGEELTTAWLIGSDRSLVFKF